MMAYYRDQLVLSVEEHTALMRFNNEVYFAGAGCAESVDHARVRAVRHLSPEVLADLASTFSTLWPHWFVNGRREMSAQQVCLDIVKKISAGCGVSVPSGLEWIGRMGGMRLTGGRKRTAVQSHGKYHGGRGVRGMKVCLLHPEQKAVSYGLCQACRNRNARLINLGYDTDRFPEALWNEIMRHDKFKHGAFARTSESMIKAHETKHNESYRMVIDA